MQYNTLEYHSLISYLTKNLTSNLPLLLNEMENSKSSKVHAYK